MGFRCLGVEGDLGVIELRVSRKFWGICGIRDLWFREAGNLELKGIDFEL